MSVPATRARRQSKNDLAAAVAAKDASNVSELEAEAIAKAEQESEHLAKEAQAAQAEAKKGTLLSVQWVEKGTAQMQDANTQSSLFNILDDELFSALPEANINVIDAEGNVSATETGMKECRAYGGFLQAREGQQVPCLIFVLDGKTLEIQTADNSAMGRDFKQYAVDNKASLNVVCRIAHGFTMDLAQDIEGGDPDPIKQMSFLSKKLSKDMSAFVGHLKTYDNDYSCFESANAAKGEFANMDDHIGLMEEQAQILIGQISDDHDSYEQEHPAMLYPPGTPLEQRYMDFDVEEQHKQNQKFDKFC